MEKKKYFRKGLVIGTILLFFGASVISGIGGPPGDMPSIKKKDFELRVDDQIQEGEDLGDPPVSLRDNDWNYWSNEPNMYSMPTGNIGIGTSSPTNLLHIVGSTSAPLLNVEKTGSGRGVRVSTTSACAIWVENSGNHGLRVTNAAGDGVHVTAAGGFAGYFNGKGYFSGNLGIGSADPAAKLDVNGAIIADTLDTGQGANQLYDMNQNVTTGSSPSFSAVSTGQLIVTGTYPTTITANDLSFNRDNYYGYIRNIGTNGRLTLQTGGSDTLYMESDGRIYMPRVYDITTSQSPNIYIDQNGKLHRSVCGEFWKKNIRPLELETSGLYDITVGTFEEKLTDKTGHSIIGDENTFNHLPNAVIKTKIALDADGNIREPEYDEQGHEIPSFEEEKTEIYDSINWNYITSAIVVEMKELKNEINELNNELNELKDRINVLENQ